MSRNMERTTLPFALAPLELHDGAVLAGDVGRAVLGVVVVDVDVGVGQDA